MNISGRRRRAGEGGVVWQGAAQRRSGRRKGRRSGAVAQRAAQGAARRRRGQFFLKKLLESAKVAQRQRRVYDLRHFRAGAKVAQNRRIVCSWARLVPRWRLKMIAMVCILTHERPRTLKRPRPVYLYIEYGDIFSANCLPSHTECARFFNVHPLRKFATLCGIASSLRTF